MGYSPWGRKQLDTTEQLTYSLSPQQYVYIYIHTYCLYIYIKE